MEARTRYQRPKAILTWHSVVIGVGYQDQIRCIARRTARTQEQNEL